MNFTGKIQNGVEVPDSDPFVQAALKLAKPRPHWPKDYALNHGHYVSGEPKNRERRFCRHVLK